jgi:hypothetical protein
VNAAHEELLRRRERLLLRSAILRQDWSQQVQLLRAPLGVADQACCAGPAMPGRAMGSTGACSV